MYAKIPNGKIVNVQGLDCCLPPVGYVYNILTDEIESRDIISNSKVPSKQKWTREELPDWYKERMRYVERVRLKDPSYSDPRCNAYETREWDRRLNGCWVMINGNPVYLTGMNYMYLQWWKIDYGYPYFRQPDLEYFYFLQYCIEDPDCLGMISIEKRRNGKTYRAGLFGHEYTSMNSESQSGIQSKTETDARKFFSKAVVTPFKKLPKFLRATYDTIGGITPKKELKFQQANVRGKKAEEALERDELNSLIDFGSSDLYAYDGQKIHRYISDEWAKTNEVNIYDRHDVIRYCLLDEKGAIIGKALYTSTVEKLKKEKDGVNEAARILWDASDHTNKTDGVTSSGLYRFFMSAAKSKIMDEYGYPDVERSETQIRARRKILENNPKSLGHAIQKEPLTVEEAFRPDSDKCLFNQFKLLAQSDFLSSFELTERGNFIWKDGQRDTEVVWVADKKGKWEMPKGFVLKQHERNLVERVGNLCYPRNSYRFGSAVDPYDHDVVEDNNKRSSAGSLVKQKNNLNNSRDPFIGAYICKYHARPPKASIMYEDMIQQCVYFGMPILYESNKPGIKKHFEERGYGPFLMKVPGYQDFGIPSTPGNKDTGLDFLEAMVEDSSDKIFFQDVIQDLLKLDINDTRKYDLGMAALWTEVACNLRKYNEPPQKEAEDVEELFPEYDINYN